MAPKRKGEPVKQPKKRGGGRPPEAVQAAKAASASDKEAEDDVQEEPVRSLDVSPQVCAQSAHGGSFQVPAKSLSLLIPKSVCTAVCRLRSRVWRECLHHAHL